MEPDRTTDPVNIKTTFEVEIEDSPKSNSEVDMSGQSNVSYDDGPIDDHAGYYEVPFCKCLSFE
jgi:hypothetical protein